MLFLFILIMPMCLFSQEIAQDTNDAQIIPLESRVDYNTKTAHDYRPGFSFQSKEVNIQGSPNNIIDSAAVSTEFSEVGRIGAIRIDGAATLPMLGIEGFVIRDPSINQGQILLDLLPYDFAERVDIYKQNLVPFGVTAGSFIDFRIPQTYELYTSVLTKISTTANLYAKVQGEVPFKDGSTFWGVVGDFGLHDYYYAINGGSDFAFYPNSTFNRTSVISKTTWKGLEFLISQNYTDSFSETATSDTAICQLTRNTLLTGLRYNQNIFTFSANYTFYNQMATAGARTNDYLNHQFSVQTGVQDKIGRYSYRALVAYELNNIEDGSRATQSNYIGIPVNGEHFFKAITEFGISVFDPKDNKPYNIDFNFALNQIVSQIGTYTPIPSFSVGFRHQKGWYVSAYVSRIYVLPDMTSAYGFGQSNPHLSSTLLPKDGLKTGGEIGYSSIWGRLYGNFSYAWLDKGFRLSEDNLTMLNTDNVLALSVELGSEWKRIHQGIVYSISTGLAWNYEKDAEGNSPSIIPRWKWISKFTVSPIDKIWLVGMNYRLTAQTPDGTGELDNTIRHYIDLNFKYKVVFLNILNLANQSYRPIPNNLYSPYNPGIRAELGVELRF